MKEEVQKKTEDPELMHSFDTMNKSLFTKSTLLFFAGVIVSGAVTGYIISNKRPGASSSSVVSQGSGSLSKGSVVGSDDKETFKDAAEGVLKEGGIEGEGQFHLERPGGESQNVYMTSSLVDLSVYVGKKVKVWGQTQTAQKAGWLMDVGRLEVL